MKKIALMCALMLVAFSVSAVDMWNYAIQFTTAPELASEAGAGANWYVALINAADNSELDSTAVSLNSGSLLFIAPYNTTLITEGLDVFYRIYNSTIVPSAPYWQIDSQTATLQNLSAGFLPGANNVSLSFSGSTWQAVPEPATFMLFGIGGIGAWLVRRKNRISA